MKITVTMVEILLTVKDDHVVLESMRWRLCGEVAAHGDDEAAAHV